MKGLNIGDTFKDGKCTYEVIEVLPDGNYISKMVGASEEDAPIVEEEKPKRRRKVTE